MTIPIVPSTVTRRQFQEVIDAQHEPIRFVCGACRWGSRQFAEYVKHVTERHPSEESDDE